MWNSYCDSMADLLLSTALIILHGVKADSDCERAKQSRFTSGVKEEDPLAAGIDSAFSPNRIVLTSLRTPTLDFSRYALYGEFSSF